MLKVFLLLLFSLLNLNVFATEISFKTRDNATIYANFEHRGKHAVVLAHGAVFDKDSWGALESRLLADNFTVLAIDFRGYHKSTAGDNPMALYEDILGAITFLRQQEAIDLVTVLGASMGGTAAAKANMYAHNQVMDQLILLSPAQVSKPQLLTGDKLFIASQDEYLAKSIQSVFEQASEPKQIQLITGSAHAQHMFKTDQAENVIKIILGFLHTAVAKK